MYVTYRTIIRGQMSTIKKCGLQMVHKCILWGKKILIATYRSTDEAVPSLLAPWNSKPATSYRSSGITSKLE